VDCYDLVVVGGSAGSLTPLRAMVGALPSDLPVPVAVTIHVPAQAHSRLPKLLSRTGQLPARHGENGDQLCAGTIYIAPPNRHMLITGGVIALSPGPKVNHSRPAIDAMFGSAARWFGDRVIAVVLSGLLEDGAVGASLITRAGGLVLVEEPQEAEYPSMPLAALDAAPGAIAVPREKLGQVVTELVGKSSAARTPRPVRSAPASQPRSYPGDVGILEETNLWSDVAALESS